MLEQPQLGEKVTSLAAQGLPWYTLRSITISASICALDDRQCVCSANDVGTDSDSELCCNWTLAELCTVHCALRRMGP